MNSFSIYQSPVGNLLLQGNTRGLMAVQFLGRASKPELSSDWQQSLAPFTQCMIQLDAYFAGQLKHFDLALTLQSTAFRGKVLNALREIPYGQTRSYGELAAQTGHPGAARAVGGAAHYNPIPIIIPCHRLIGANGNLTGFAAGLKVKKYLLDLEKKHR